MKRNIILGIFLSLCLLLSGCSSKVSTGLQIVSEAVDEMRELEVSPSPSTLPQPTLTPRATPEVLPEPTPEPTPEVSPEPTPVPTPTPQTDSFLTGADRADYLRIAPFSDQANDEQRRAFVKVVESGVSSHFHAEDNIASLCESAIYGEEANVGFLLSCADISGLTDAGILNVFPDCNMQYRYLLDVNGFSAYPLGQCIPFGGTMTPQAGDLVFWLDEQGEAVNYAVICGVAENYIRVVLCRPDGTRATMDMNWANLGVKCSGNAVVVQLIYPKNEQFVYLFCVNNMKLTPAAACGVMANIYKESSFRNYIESDGSYGLCQWLGARRGTLVTWCRENGLDYTTLYGQLCFMQHELSYEKYAPLVRILYSLGNTPEDAAKAAREWCYKFEQPANAGTIGYDRGLSASNDFFPIYSQYGY